jgi:hypothetical protein
MSDSSTDQDVELAESCARGLRSVVADYAERDCDAAIKIVSIVDAAGQPTGHPENDDQWRQISLEGIRVVGCLIRLDMENFTRLFSPRFVVLSMKPVPRTEPAAH